MNLENCSQQNRDDQYREYFDGKQREYLRTLICDRVIEEYKQNPLGQHSEPLERLLIYFRRLPLRGQFALEFDKTSLRFRILALSGERGIAPSPVGSESFDKIEDAYHAIFLKHIERLMES